MKTVFPWLVALIFVALSVYLWVNSDTEYIEGGVVYDTLRIQNPVNEKLELQATIYYRTSEERQRKIDSLEFAIKQFETLNAGENNFVKELITVIHKLEGQKDSLASAKFEIGEYEGEVIYRFAEQKFEIDYKKLFEVFARERIPGVQFGLSCYLWKQKEYGLKFGGMVGFPKLLKNTYLGIEANSFGGFGAGLHYIF